MALTRSDIEAFEFNYHGAVLLNRAREKALETYAFLREVVREGDELRAKQMAPVVTDALPMAVELTQLHEQVKALLAGWERDHRPLLGLPELPPPTVVLNGDASVSLVLGTPWIDPGATATDFCGNPVDVIVTGTVDVQALGEYTITYSATDAWGRVGSAVRFVTVAEEEPPV
jgi:hypothetical protein